MLRIRGCGLEDAKGSSEGVGLWIHFARLEEGACTTIYSCHCVHFVTSFGAGGSATEFGARRGCTLTMKDPRLGVRLQEGNGLMSPLLDQLGSGLALWVGHSQLATTVNGHSYYLGTLQGSTDKLCLGVICYLHFVTTMYMGRCHHTLQDNLRAALHATDEVDIIWSSKAKQQKKHHHRSRGTCLLFI